MIDPFCEKEDGAHQTPNSKQQEIFKRRKLNGWDRCQLLSTAPTPNMNISGMHTSKHEHLYVHKPKHSNNNTARVVVRFVEDGLEKVHNLSSRLDTVHNDALRHVMCDQEKIL